MPSFGARQIIRSPAETQESSQRNFQTLPERGGLKARRRLKPALHAVMRFIMEDRMNQVFQDLRYGLRLMRKNPGVSAAAVLTIALGIAAATAIFSVVYGVALQPLPYREPHRLVTLWTKAP